MHYDYSIRMYFNQSTCLTYDRSTMLISHACAMVIVRDGTTNTFYYDRFFWELRSAADPLFIEVFGARIVAYDGSMWLTLAPFVCCH